MRRRKHSMWFTVGAGMFEALAVAGILWVAQLGRVNTTVPYEARDVAAQLEQSASVMQQAVTRHVGELVSP
mgnify:CR=1 FL=1